MRWLSVQTRRCVSRVVPTATLQCGTFTTRPWSVSSKVTLMVHRALTSPLMVPSYGPADWTIRCAPGISEKVVNYSSTTSPHKSSPWDIVRLGNGSPWEWRTLTWRCCTRSNPTSTSCTCTSRACSACGLRPAGNGLCLRAKIIC
uniref:Uncharacterized protein n=1 Tax=Cacopsylla melanoneura TaxID=428564 RepID=A0A8D8ZP35_9HEMI